METNVDFINLQYIFYKIYQFFTGSFELSMGEYWPLITLISFVLSMLLAIACVYYYLKIKEVEKMDEVIFGTVLKTESENGETQNERWLRVVEHLDTESQSEWRTAILEADIILDEMTVKMGYQGENLGERLRSVEKSDFLTIDKAWEAHKVRNTIAHEGSDYILSKREAKRIIELYRQVFEEFNFI